MDVNILSEVYLKYRKAISRGLTKRLFILDHSIIEDAIQNAMLRMIRTNPDLHTYDEYKERLGIESRFALGKLTRRMAKREEGIQITYHNPETEVIKNQELKILNREIDNLPYTCQLALKAFMDTGSFVDAAEILNCNQITLRHNVYYAYKKLNRLPFDHITEPGAVEFMPMNIEEDI